MNILGEIRVKADEILNIRRDIHMYPELGNMEYRTSEIIAQYLLGLGITVRRAAGTGIIGILNCSEPGKTAALRADMDALPVCESTGAGYASRNSGIMHACGHDVHTAALLGTAGMLADHRDEINGTVIFIFQPDEEGDGGAARMIDAGALDGADAVFGAHVSPELPSGTAGFRCGSFYAAADTFDVSVRGRSSHAAERDKGIDAVGAASEMVTRLLRIPAEIKKAAEHTGYSACQTEYSNSNCVLSVGTFNAGSARNILADRAEFSGIVRTHGTQLRAKVRDAFTETIRETDMEFCTNTTVRYMSGYPGVTNDDRMTELAAGAAARLLGSGNTVWIDRPTMMTEDFGCYQQKVPGCFYHIGAGCDSPLHSPEFLPSDEAVLTAAAVHAAVVTEFLGRGMSR